MALDAPTLLFVTGLVIAFCGLLMIVAGGGRSGAGAMTVWGCAMLLGAGGLVSMATGRPGPGNVLLLAATAASWTAARLFAERAARPPSAALGPAVWLAADAAGASPSVGLAHACAIGAAYTFAAAAELRRTRAERLPSRPWALALLLSHGAIYAARAAQAALAQGPAGVRAGEAVVDALLLESLLHTIGMAFLLLAMTRERGELRSGEQLRALAWLDGLTGVANRRRFDEHIDAECRRACRNGAPLGLLFIDVDCFKAFNDAFGHQRGDACLRAVARTVSGLVNRPGDLVARYGGEEFAVLLAGADMPGAVDVAEAIRAAVEASGAGVTISVGAASVTPRGPAAAETLVRLADRALYDAKAGGRNKVRSAAPEAPAAAGPPRAPAQTPALAA